MRLTWLSNCPWTPFGYGVETALFATRLVRAGHAVGVISTFGHQGSPITWNGVQVFGPSFHPYAQDIMSGHSRTFKADALISLVDVQIFEPDKLQGVPWIPWVPIDHVTIPPIIAEKLKAATTVLAMSKHASGEMDKAGIPHSYIPLGVDTNLFKPLPMMECREKMQFPKDKFIVGMVAANKGTPSRKAFQANIAAFAALRSKHPDCLLYLHTLDGISGGWEAENLFSFCKVLGLRTGHVYRDNPDEMDVLFADQYGLALGYTPEMMVNLFSAMDVHLLVSMGEGFGIPLVEAQACGTPVITGSWTSMPELCFSGWKVGIEETEKIFTPLESIHCLPHSEAIAERLFAAYEMRGNQDYRDRARSGSLAYDADKITEKYWLPFLGTLETKLQEIRIPDSLAVNLEMLRVTE